MKYIKRWQEKLKMKQRNGNRKLNEGIGDKKERMNEFENYAEVWIVIKEGEEKK